MVFSEYCSIEYYDKQHSRVFYPGEIVSGVIKLDLQEKEKHFEDLVLEARGRAKCKWGDRRISVEYLKHSKSLFDDTFERIDGSVVLPIGVHKLFFTFRLPCGIPPSLDTEYGMVKYNIKVTAQRSTCFDKSASWDFTVDNEINLNVDPSNKSPINHAITHEFYSFNAYKGTLNINVYIPYSGYARGQEIFIDCDINNENTQVTLNEILYSLRKTTTFKCYDPIPSCKISYENVCECSGESVKMGLRSRQMLKMKLSDSLTPSISIDVCPISIKYSIEIKTVSTADKNCIAQIPINIGTVPLDENLIREIEPNISTPCYSMVSGESANGPFVNPYGAIENPCSLFITPNPPSINLGNLILNVNPSKYLNESTNPSAPNEEITTPPGIGFSIPPSSSSSSVDAPPTYEESLILLAGMQLKDQNNKPSSSHIDGA